MNCVKTDSRASLSENIFNHPTRIKMEGPLFKTTALHQPFNSLQQAPLAVQTKVSTNHRRTESRQKGELFRLIVLHWKIPAKESETNRTNNATQNTEKDDKGFNNSRGWISKLCNIVHIFRVNTFLDLLKTSQSKVLTFLQLTTKLIILLIPCSQIVIHKKK